MIFRYSIFPIPKLMVFAMLALSTSVLSQSTKHVSLQGDDSNDGNTLKTAYRTIQKALDVAVAGTTILVEPGTYLERLHWINSGTSEKVITLTKSSTNGRVIIDGGTHYTYLGKNPLLFEHTVQYNTNKAIININDKSHIAIKNITLEDNYQQGAKGINISGSGDFITIERCTIRNIGFIPEKSTVPSINPYDRNNAHGILVVGSSSNSISNIKIVGNYLTNCVVGRSETLTLVGNVEKFIVKDNFLFDNTNIGIDIAGHWGWTGAPANVNQARDGEVIGNTVKKCNTRTTDSAAGIYVDGGKNILIERNGCYRNDVGFSIGCEVSGKNGINRASGITMRNNISAFNHHSGLILGSASANATVSNSNIRNNSFYQNQLEGNGEGAEILIQICEEDTLIQNIISLYEKQCYAIANFGSEYKKLTCSNNLSYRPKSNCGKAYKIVHGLKHNLNSKNKIRENTDFSGDPMFALFSIAALPENIDLRLKPGSPAIDKGREHSTVPKEVDFLSAPRVKGKRVDLGAFESNW